MEFLRDNDITNIETVTLNDKTIIDSGAETKSRHGDPSVDLETPDVWPDHQDRNNRETIGKWLRWLHIIGENIG